MTYALRLSEDEVARYRMMAHHARILEADLWERAGLRPGARVADVGCGPGAMLAVQAEVAGPGGQVVGVDDDERAVRAAAELLADAEVGNAEVRRGRADDTGLPTASFDVVVLRHVLAHNGGAEQRIVDHLAGLVRPGGHVLLVDVDLTAATADPPLPAALEDLMRRYQRWHTDRGNDLAVGRRLDQLARAAGLAVEEFRDLSVAVEVGTGMRGPAWAARQELVRAELASTADVARWAAAFDEIDSWTRRPRLALRTFAAVCRRTEGDGTAIAQHPTGAHPERGR